MGVENYIFWSEIWSGFEETGGTPPPRIPMSVPRDKRRRQSEECGNLHHPDIYDCFSAR